MVDGDVRGVRESTEMGAVAPADQMMQLAVDRFGRLQVALER